MRALSVTELLQRVTGGDRDAEAELAPVVQAELYRLARSKLRNERIDHTLQPTALVNEVYLKLFSQKKVTWRNRSHFYKAAAANMRRILVDYARNRNAAKRKGIRVSLEDALIVAEEQCELVEQLDDALQRLAQLNERQSRIVEMHFFGGQTFVEIAKALHCSLRTAKREWEMARGFLYGELFEDDDQKPDG